ncbi:hypothetical protein QUB80_16960 [Chlorogloeopsis sp. ULAP01]|uniref:hypothetical protein n=1 Tax=Chlorogloeopsis sp. ULAP01 TaxID=3056483 RepID=UPI0025AA5DD4|nr:hypothetical protein [Chlorogloeopsis sp. ULAP01]MDM9382394.1 hypothetical protein [Chlorogloeopsis sp. ULAP01]
MLAYNYTYESTLKDAYKVNWRVEDLIGNDKRLDFTKPFLPDALAGVKAITCLNQQEKLILNQIRGNSYLHLFGVVEEFILPLVIDHVQQTGYEDMQATQAFLHFAEEESKHIRLFRRFAEEFELGFGTKCNCIGPAKEIAEAVLKHSQLGVALVTLHIEWMTQHHYLDSVRNNQAEALDPQFCSLLRHHWMEEAQHARLDTLMVKHIAQELDFKGIETGINDYVAIVNLLDGGLKAQVQLDIESLSLATGRILNKPERQQIQAAQEKFYRWTFIGSGMTHPNFVQVVGELSKSGQMMIAQIAQEASTL